MLEDFLGFLLTVDNSIIREIRRRIISGSRAYPKAYQGLHKNLRLKKDVQNADKTSGSVRARNLGHAGGGHASTRSVQASGSYDHLWRCAGELCVAAKDEPRVRMCVWK